ncbi:PAS domain S-box protein [Thaumasiovibrio subtropicus]|uniref:PAS domain S-box protein n=1 Tax=Thaumasiovibrio subtropicus TaxID=1891207 RepID=UPI000B361B4E|nr:PAS domain S-box protein [Thaumasiovibrio subtropicus]
MKIAIKLPLFYTALALMIFASIYYIADQGRSMHMTDVQKSTAREATAMINLIEQHMFERYDDATAFPLTFGRVSNKTFAHNATSPETSRYLNELVKRYPFYRRIVIFDGNGNVLASNTRSALGKTLPSLATSPDVISKTRWFRDVLNGVTLSPSLPNSAYVAGPLQSALEQKSQYYDMIFASRILDDEGEVIGIWLNLLDFGSVEELVKESYQQLIALGYPTAELTLIDRQGNVIVDFDPTGQNEANYTRDHNVLGKFNLVEQDLKFAQLAISGLTGSSISTHARKKINQVTGFAHTAGAYQYPGLSWSAIVRIPTEDALVSARPIYEAAVSAAMGLLIIIIGSALYVSLYMVRPMQHAARTINQLAIGKRSLELPAQHDKDEVYAVFDSIDNLRNMLVERDALLTTSHNQQLALDMQKRIIDSTATGIVVCDFQDKHHRITFVNRAFENLTGYFKDEVIGKPFSFIYLSKDDPNASSMFKSSMCNGASWTSAIKSRKKDGSYFYNNIRIDPVHDENGHITHYISVHSDITELKSAEEKHRLTLKQQVDDRTRESKETESRLRAVFDTTHDGTVVIDSNGIILDVNRSLEVIFGHRREALLGENLSRLLGEGHYSYIRQHLSTENPKIIRKNLKVNGVHKSGHTLPIELSIGQTHLGDEKAFVIIVRDITEKERVLLREQQLKDELTEREVIYRAAFSQAAVGISRIDLDGRFLEVNDKMCQSFEYPEKDLLRMTLKEVIHGDAWPNIQSAMATLIENDKKFFTADSQYIKRTSIVFWANLSISLVRDIYEQPKYFIAVIEDITERKAFEKELSDSRNEREELLRGIKLASDAGGVCNWSYNLITGDLKWDESMFQLYGVPSSTETVYSTWRDCVHPDDVEMAEKEVMYSIDHCCPFNCVFRIINATTKSVQYIKAAADVICDDGGNAIQMYGINLDITDERLTQIELEKETVAAQQASEAKSRFLATMSHEIRTPMNGIIGMIDLLGSSSLVAEQQRMVTTIRDSSFSLLEIINDILDFSKIESGQMALEIVDTSLLSIMEKTADALWVNAHNKRVEVYIEHDFSVPATLRLDAIRVRQILMNLLGNAIKFTHSDTAAGLVVISNQYLSEQQALSISVRDNGVGMTQEQMSKLFRPFTQADSTTTRKYGGTGLGLSITKSFVELMGGQITVESEIHRGSLFTITLPLTPPVFSGASIQYDFSNIFVSLQVDELRLRHACASTLDQLKTQSVPQAHTKTITVTDNVDFDPPKNEAVLFISHLQDPAKLCWQCFSIGCHPLKPSELIEGLAILSGQASPKLEWHCEENDNLDAVPLSREQAIARGELILCAEDQPTNRLVLSSQLAKLGFVFDMVENGQEALEAWKSGQYQIVLTDCHMPMMDGYELTAEIRRLEAHLPEPKTTIIAITANALSGEAENCISAGMNDYIAKPVELNCLKSILSQWLRSDGGSAKSPPVDAGSEHPQAHVEDLTVIDLPHLIKVIGTDDRSLVDAVLQMFLDNVGNDINAIDMATKCQDADTVRSKAHGAKGAAASSGLLNLSEKLKEIEKHAEHFERVIEVLPEIQQALNALKEQLKTEGVIN